MRQTDFSTVIPGGDWCLRPSELRGLVSAMRERVAAALSAVSGAARRVRSISRASGGAFSLGGFALPVANFGGAA